VGGSAATGGTAATATSGVAPTGGSKTNGGAPQTGGTNSTGGTVANAATGGIQATGGVPSTGGASLPTGGSRTASGGAPTGGAQAAGGTISTGGAVATGGSKTAGGATSIPSCAAVPTGHYQMENIDRGVVAVKVTGGVYVSWRMMGYEYDPTNPTSISYNVYRSGTKVASVTDSTNYLDAAGTASSTYTVTPVCSGTEGPQSPSVKTWAQDYLDVPISPPPTGKNGGTYSAGDTSPGDLDGDGQYDLVLKWDPSNEKDPSQTGLTDDVIIDGVKLDGTRLWRIDLGPNIRASAHETQMSVYDFDGDGKAEFACKTAPGTKDGTGAYLHTGPAATDSQTTSYVTTDTTSASYGFILSGPEYLTVFDGATGKELQTVPYPVPRGTVSSWGDNYGNRVSRFNGGFAFVKTGGAADGRPSIVQQRGYYTRLTMSAYNWRNGALTKNWIYDSVTSLSQYGAGCHSSMAADVDNDGAQEIITGATTIHDDGSLLCTTGLGHGDALDVGELIVGQGITVYQIHESLGGNDCHNAATCKTYFNNEDQGTDSNRGRADYVTATDTTSASTYVGDAKFAPSHCGDGTTAGATSPGSNFVIYWDADESRELENGTSITKAGGGTLLNATGTASCNGSKATPNLSADILGDWREELILHTTDSTALRIFTTTAVTTRRIYTLMHDPTYRAQVNWEQASYNQPPHTGFHIGAGMANPPKPDIYVK
jgi:hypothetical protein